MADGPGGVTGFAEVTLETRDMAALEAFYTGVLGLPVLQRRDDRVWLGVGDHARLGLWSPGEKEFGDRGGRHVHFAFSAAPGSLDAAADALRAAGRPVRGPVEHPGGDRSVYTSDPEGNVVELWDVFERSEGRRQGVDLVAD
jgi:catechol-2,3-dioxygenase